MVHRWTVEGHNQRLNAVLAQFQKHNVHTGKSEQCTFVAKAIEFLGYKVTAEVTQIHSNIKCINQLPRPKRNNLYDFFLRNWRNILVRIYIDMTDMNNIFHWIFVLCNLDLWFRSYSKSCEVPLNLFGLDMNEPV